MKVVFQSRWIAFRAEPCVASRVLSLHKEIPMPEKTLATCFWRS